MSDADHPAVYIFLCVASRSARPNCERPVIYVCVYFVVFAGVCSLTGDELHRGSFGIWA